MKVEILANTIYGYSTPAYTWDCIMCDSYILRDLDLDWMRARVRAHLEDSHNVHSNRITFKVVSAMRPVAIDNTYRTEVLVIDKDRDGGLDVSFVQMEGAENWVSNYAAEQWPNAIYMLVSIMID